MAGLAELSGGMLGAQVKLALRQAVHDCESRPNVDAVRRVTIVVNVHPKVQPDSGFGDSLREVVVSADTSIKLPKMMTAEHHARVLPEHRAAFQSLSPESADQRPLPGLGGDEDNAGATRSERVDTTTGEIMDDDMEDEL